MESKRQSKISKVLQKDLAEIVRLLPRSILSGSMVTITKVNVTPDLSIAKIYLSIFGTDKKEEVLLNIKKQSKNIRHQLSMKIRHQMRAVPELQFYLDDSLDYIENIENLLKED